METTRTESGTAKVIRLEGHLEGAAGARLSDEGRKVLGGGEDLIVDLSGVGFCDSAGLSSLVSLFKCAGENHRQFILSAPRANLLSLLELTRLHRVFHIESDVESALSAVGGA